MNKVLFVSNVAQFRFKVRSALEREIECLFAKTTPEALKIFRENRDSLAMVVIDDTLTEASSLVHSLRTGEKWWGVNNLLIVCSDNGPYLDLIREAHAFGINTEQFIGWVREYVVFELPRRLRGLQ